MIYPYFKKWLIVFSLIASAYAIIYACGGDGYWPSVRNFDPQSFDDYYSPNLFESWSQLPNPEDYDTRFNDTVLSDWKRYLENEINESDLSVLLFQSSKNQIDSLFQFSSKGINNKQSIYWSKKINLQNTRIRNFIEFMHHAKKVEQFCLNSNQSLWNYKGEEKPEMDTKLFDDLKLKFESVSDKFIKNRYWFQVIKAGFYSEDPLQTIPFFTETESQMPHNLIYFRAMNYVAGIYNKNQNYAEANYTYSLIFNQCETLQADASYGFHPMENEDWEACLMLAKSTEEKATLWSLFGYYADEIKAINEIYNIDPKSRHLDYLLASIIAKEERRIDNDIEYSSIYDRPLESFKEYKLKFKEIQNSELYELIERIAKSEKTKSPYLWHLALAYFHILNGNHQIAKPYIDLAEMSTKLNPSGKNQIRLMRYINNLSAMDTITESNEKLIYNDLNWILTEYNKIDTLNEYGNPRFEAAVNWSKKYLHYLYEAKGDKIMSELFVRTDRIFESEKDYMKMRSFLIKPNKSEYEKMAASLYNLSVEDIDHFRAVRYGFHNKLDEAIAIFEKLPPERNTELLGNPFNGGIKDCHDCDHQAKQKIKFTRLSLLIKMRELKQNIAKNENVYNNALLLGKAFYNMSHFGNARVFHQNNIIDGYYGYMEYIPDTYKPLILDMSVSQYYFKMALEHAKTDEQKAKCWYLLAKCERNEYYYRNLNIPYDNTSSLKDFMAWQGFRELKENYSNTKYYRDVISECGYFKTYVKQTRKR